MVSGKSLFLELELMGLKTIAVNIHRCVREVCMTSGAKKELQFGAVITTVPARLGQEITTASS